MRLRAGAATRKGRARERNEDTYVLRIRDGLFVVCDGIGSAASGELASQIAVDTIVRELEPPMVQPVCEADGRQQLPQAWRLAQAIKESNRVIYDHAQNNADGAEMGTTVVSAWVQNHVVSLAHVGDSRAYLWRDARLEVLTKDHTLFEALESEGLTTSWDDQEGDPRDILLRAVGCEPDVQVDVLELPVRSGDYLLLCSDGLTRAVPAAQLMAIISESGDPQALCDYLISNAGDAGYADDVTVVVVEVLDATLVADAIAQPD